MVAADWFFVVFRLIHIVAGVLWVGGVFLFVVFVQPSAAAIGPDAGPMMGQLLGVRKLPDRLLLLAAITIAAGLVLYIKLWSDKGSFGDWVGSSYGLALTIGMLAAIAAALVGALGTKPRVKQLMALQGQVAASGGPPSPEQGAQVAVLQGQLKVLARTSFALLIVAVAMMATAQYW